MFPNLSRFLGLLIGQRDALRKVVDLDKRDLDLQAKLTAFRDGAVPRAGAGGVYFAPIGRTLQLLATIDPENGYGAADDAYQATIAEMIQGGLGSYLPLLRATHEAHRDLCSQARKAAERSGGVEDLASSLEVHCRVVMYLTDLANSQAYAKPETPVVGTAGGTVGTTAAAVEDRSKHPWGDDDPDTPLTPAKIAYRLGIPQNDGGREALRKRLEKWRKDNPGGGWIEDADSGGRKAKYIYLIGKVWPVVSDMKRSG